MPEANFQNIPIEYNGRPPALADSAGLLVNRLMRHEAAETSAQTTQATTGVGRVIIGNVVVSTALVVPSHLAEQLSPRDDFTVRQHEPTGDSYYFTPGSNDSDEHFGALLRQRKAQVANAPLHVPAQYESPSDISAKQAAQLLRAQPSKGEGIVIITGSGISTPEAPTHEELAKTIGFTLKQPTKQQLKENAAFAKRFVQDSITAERTVAVFKGYVEKIQNPQPTKAHKAISSIMEQMDYNPLVGTLNADEKHAGAGLFVPRLQLRWPNGLTSSSPKEQALNEELQRRVTGDGVNLIFLVGLGQDEKGLARYVRGLNPNAAVMASNIAPRKHLPYLDRDSRYLKGNAQVTLPRLATWLTRIS